MTSLREFRKTLTYGTLRAGVSLSKHASHPRVVEGMRHVFRGLSKVVLPFRQQVVSNMKAVGLYRDGLYGEYVERAIDQYIMMAHVFRAGVEESNIQDRFVFDESFSILQQAFDQGKGVLNIAPHISGYPAYGGLLDLRIPTSIYLRRNKDPRKMKINEAAGLAGKGRLVYPPEGATAAQKLQVAMDIVRRGETLFITPDNPRKPNKGYPVQVLGRTAYFPLGVYIMSMRTGAPVVPVFWEWRDGRYHVSFREPIVLERRKGIQEEAQRAVRHWATMVDEFLRAHPEMFWSWPDKRWTQIIRREGAFANAPELAEPPVACDPAVPLP